MSEEEMTEIKTILTEIGSDSQENLFWIGLTDEQTERNFVWASTGNEANYTYWHWSRGEPNGNEDENCVYLEGYWYDRQWNDRSCNTSDIYALCQIG